MAINLNKFYFDNHFKMDGTLVYGIYRNRTMSIKEKSSVVKVTISFNRQLLKENGSIVSTKMSELKQKHRALQHALTTNLCLELILYKSADIEKEFLPILDDCLNVLDELHPSDVEICPLCGQVKPSNAPFVKIKDNVLQAHEHCIDQLIATSNQMGNELIFKFDKKNFFKSLLISTILFLTIVGVICLLSYYGLFTFFAALSGWGLYFLFNLVSKKAEIKVRKAEIIMISVMSIFCVVVSIYLGSVIDIFKSVENVTLIDVFKYYFTLIVQNFSTYGKFVVIELVLGLAFIVPSLVVNIKYLNERAKGIKKLKD